MRAHEYHIRLLQEHRARILCNAHCALYLIYCNTGSFFFLFLYQIYQYFDDACNIMIINALCIVPVHGRGRVDISTVHSDHLRTRNVVRKSFSNTKQNPCGKPIMVNNTGGRFRISYKRSMKKIITTIHWSVSADQQLHGIQIASRNNVKNHVF
jgi:hypothetical protein